MHTMKRILVCGLALFVLIAVTYAQERGAIRPAPRGVVPAPRQDQSTGNRQPSLTDELPLRNWTIRETAADALWRIGPAAVPALIDSLKDPDGYVRFLAARSLAHLGSDAEAAVPALIVALDDPEELVRRQAARALGQIGPAAADAIPALINKLQAEANRSG